MATKVCKKCGKEKPKTYEYFHKDRDGFHAKCKVCRNSVNPVITGKGEKVCSGCGKTKSATLEFFHKSKREKDGLRKKCKVCRSKEKKIYRDKNKDEINAQAREYNSRPEVKEMRKRTPEQKIERNKQQRERWKTNEEYKTYHLLVNGLNSMLSGQTKTCRTLNYIGCSKEELVAHLNKTKPDTDQPLHIDHIIPKNLYNLTEQDLKKCWNYRNLRWITAEENLKKGCALNMDLVRTYKIQDLLP